ncbi:conserved hypothetical protein [Ricinus communis]|uniref:Reverse transcriptase zinc-binding domain-containing protein n=1 Tax=Ricinus communis TaxID=3988 RepID=B9SJP8_RICCO|nr:conserved hypothetical protein [Ricinus communis]
MSSQAMSRPSSSSQDPNWKKLWRINIPPKERQFLWRACTDTLTTESWTHPTLKCPLIQRLWNKLCFKAKEFQDLQQRTCILEQEPPAIVKWNLPEQGMRKANTDAAIYKVGKMGFG